MRHCWFLLKVLSIFFPTWTMVRVQKGFYSGHIFNGATCPRASRLLNFFKGFLSVLNSLNQCKTVIFVNLLDQRKHLEVVLPRRKQNLIVLLLRRVLDFLHLLPWQIIRSRYCATSGSHSVGARTQLPLGAVLSSEAPWQIPSPRAVLWASALTGRRESQYLESKHCTFPVLWKLLHYSL